MDRDNAVNVLGHDERMRYGLVVDVAEDGLFVDLLCPHRRREYAPFGSVFFKRELNSNDFYDFRAQQQPVVPVEVLVPETASGPWIWQNGEMSLIPRETFAGAVVHWQTPDTGVLCTEFVSVDRVCPRLDTSNWRKQAKRFKLRTELRSYGRVEAGAFTMHKVQLGERFRSFSAEESKALLKRVNDSGIRHRGLFVVDLVDGELKYIYRKTINILYEGNHEALLRMVQHFHTDKPEMSTNLNGVAQGALPVELWQEVFSHLDTVHQKKLRAVCATWNHIMDAPALSSTIAIHSDARHFLNLTSVYQSLRPSTHRLTISHDKELWEFSNYAWPVSDLIQYWAARQTGIRLRTIHLHRAVVDSAITSSRDASHAVECDLHPSPSNAGFGCGWLQDFFDVCRSLPCDGVLITKGVVSLLSSFYIGLIDDAIGAQIHISIRSVSLRLDTDFACEMWNALEERLPEARVEKLQELVKHLNLGGDFKGKKLLRQLFCKTLCGVQSVNPRPSAHYHGKKWCVDGLEELRMEKLSRLTRYFLVEVLRNAAKFIR